MSSDRYQSLLRFHAARIPNKSLHTVYDPLEKTTFLTAALLQEESCFEV